MQYSWRPDLPDQRDFLYAAHLPAEGAATLPPLVDLRSECSPVEDQGALGSCTGQAWAGLMEFLCKKQGLPFVNISRLFIYYNEREIEGTVNQDAGAYIRDGAKTLGKDGVCAESLWPYDVRKFARKPTAKAYRDATLRKLKNYYRLNGLADFKASLASGYPVVFGFSVYESFESAAVATTGIVPMPAKNERLLGGHAVLAVGYNDAREVLIVRNSWGESWGDKGYFYLPYSFIANRALSDDFWTAR